MHVCTETMQTASAHYSCQLNLYSNTYQFNAANQQTIAEQHLNTKLVDTDVNPSVICIMYFMSFVYFMYIYHHYMYIHCTDLKITKGFKKIFSCLILQELCKSCECVCIHNHDRWFMHCIREEMKCLCTALERK